MSMDLETAGFSVLALVAFLLFGLDLCRWIKLRICDLFEFIFHRRRSSDDEKQEWMD